MRGIRPHLPPVAAVVLAAFCVASAAPSAGFLVHRHAHGDLAHHHHGGGRIDSGDAEIDALLGDALGARAGHRHRPRGAAAAESGFEVAGHDHGGAAHWHSESPFQHAIATRSPALPAVGREEPNRPLEVAAHVAAAAEQTRARSPPRLA